jgi:hypothetical protein
MARGVARTFGFGNKLAELIMHARSEHVTMNADWMPDDAPVAAMPPDDLHAMRLVLRSDVSSAARHQASEST